MTPDASGWRSPTGYEHVDDLSASDLAWEWLRRNDSYDRDFQALAETSADPRPLADEIRQRWGLRFPGRPSAFSPECKGIMAPARRYQHHRAWRGPAVFLRRR